MLQNVKLISKALFMRTHHKRRITNKRIDSETEIKNFFFCLNKEFT